MVRRSIAGIDASVAADNNAPNCLNPHSLPGRFIFRRAHSLRCPTYRAPAVLRNLTKLLEWFWPRRTRSSQRLTRRLRIDSLEGRQLLAVVPHLVRKILPAPRVAIRASSPTPTGRSTSPTPTTPLAKSGERATAASRQSATITLHLLTPRSKFSARYFPHVLPILRTV